MRRGSVPSAPTVYSSQDLPTVEDLPTAVGTVPLQEGQVLVTVSRPLTPRGVTLNAVASPDGVSTITARLVRLARELKINAVVQQAISEALEL